MQIIDRWRKWRPADKTFKLPEQVPPKPSKVTYGGFEGAVSGLPQIILPVLELVDQDAFDLLDDVRQPFLEWFDARIWLGAESLDLCRLSPRWSSGVNVLHTDFCSWLLAHDLAPVTCDQFCHLLRELCCDLRLIHGEEFVSNVGLRKDVEAQPRLSENEDQ